MWVKVTSEKANVWDREQGDPERGLSVPTNGEPVEVEATNAIMAAVKDGRLVEVKESKKEDPKGKDPDKKDK